MKRAPSVVRSCPYNVAGSPAARRVRSARGERRRATRDADVCTEPRTCPHPTPVHRGLHLKKLAPRRLVQPAVIRSVESSTTLRNARDSREVSNNPQGGAMATDGLYPMPLTPGTATETSKVVEQPSPSNKCGRTVRHLGDCCAPLLERAGGDGPDADVVRMAPMGTAARGSGSSSLLRVRSKRPNAPCCQNQRHRAKQRAAPMNTRQQQPPRRREPRVSSDPVRITLRHQPRRSPAISADGCMPC